MRGQIPRLALFPVTAETRNGHLVIGGCDTVELVRDFGSPLYLFDEITLHCTSVLFKEEFRQRYHDTTVLYASKAFINGALARLLAQEELGLDVVSAGELGIARAARFPLERVYLHGNNKSEEELRLALDWRVGRIVVDNFHELEMLARLAEEKGVKPDILLRLTPGIDPHTHRYITTGIIDSKFGFPLANFEEAVVKAMSAPSLNLLGIHFHLGSLIFETEPYCRAIRVALELAKKFQPNHGFRLEELNIGGGFSVQYTVDAPATPVSAYAEAIVEAVRGKCGEMGLDLPRLVIEPGRAIVAQAGVALYTAGAIKHITGVRRYVSVDGGMGDNIRPAIYGARYEALLANKALEGNSEMVTIAGRFCESGDILIKDILLPSVSSGDIVAIPACGAYCIPMSSNYNSSLKPAIVMVREGRATLIRRRETLEDLMRCDPD